VTLNFLFLFCWSRQTSRIDALRILESWAIREFYGCLGSLSHHFLMEIGLPASKLEGIKIPSDAVIECSWERGEPRLEPRMPARAAHPGGVSWLDHALRFLIIWLELEWNLEKASKHTFSGAKCSFKSFDWEEAGCGGAPTRQLLHSQLWSGVSGKKIQSLNRADREDV